MSKTLNVISENNDDLGWDFIRSKGAVTPQPTPAPTDYFAHKYILSEDEINGYESPDDHVIAIPNLSEWFTRQDPEQAMKLITFSADAASDDFLQGFQISFVFDDGRILTSSSNTYYNEYFAPEELMDWYPYYNNRITFSAVAEAGAEFTVTYGADGETIVLSFYVSIETDAETGDAHVAVNVVENNDFYNAATYTCEKEEDSVDHLQKIVFWCESYNIAQKELPSE